MKKTKVIVLMGLLIALDVIASTYLTIKTPIVRIGFSFVPVSLTGILLGPIFGGVGAGLADLIQYVLMPQGAFIPGLTLSSALMGATYGLVYYSHKPTILRTLVAVSFCRVFYSILLNSFFLYLAMPGNTFFAIMTTRIPQNLILIPIQTIVIYAVWQTSFRTKLVGKLAN